MRAPSRARIGPQAVKLQTNLGPRDADTVRPSLDGRRGDGRAAADGKTRWHAAHIPKPQEARRQGGWHRRRVLQGGGNERGRAPEIHGGP